MTQDSFRAFVRRLLTEYKKLKWEQNRVLLHRRGARTSVSFHILRGGKRKEWKAASSCASFRFEVKRLRRTSERMVFDWKHCGSKFFESLWRAPGTLWAPVSDWDDGNRLNAVYSAAPSGSSLTAVPFQWHVKEAALPAITLTPLLRRWQESF